MVEELASINSRISRISDQQTQSDCSDSSAILSGQLRALNRLRGRIGECDLLFFAQKNADMANRQESPNPNILKAEKALRLVPLMKSLREDLISLNSKFLMEEDEELLALENDLDTNFRSLIWEFTSEPNGLVNYNKNPEIIDLNNSQTRGSFNRYLEKNLKIYGKVSNSSKVEDIQKCQALVGKLVNKYNSIAEVERSRYEPLYQDVRSVLGKDFELILSFQHVLEAQNKRNSSKEIKSLIQTGIELLAIQNGIVDHSIRSLEALELIPKYLEAFTKHYLQAFKEDVKICLQGERAARKASASQ